MNQKRPEIVNLLILTLIVVVFWIFFSVYRVFTEKPTAIVPEEVIVPLDPKFDMNTLEQIKLREFLTDVPQTVLTTPLPTTAPATEEVEETEEVEPVEPTEEPI